MENTERGTRKKYTKEFKLEAVRMLEAGERIRQTDREGSGHRQRPGLQMAQGVRRLGRAGLPRQRHPTGRGVGAASQGESPRCERIGKYFEK